MLYRTLSLLIAVFLLTGCAASIKGSVTAEAPRNLTKPCPKPVKINPNRNIENQWRKDRKNLTVCRDRHGNLVRFHQRANRILNR
jgi:uncharacterized lipoprotein YajG